MYSQYRYSDDIRVSRCTLHVFLKVKLSVNYYSQVFKRESISCSQTLMLMVVTFLCCATSNRPEFFDQEIISHIALFAKISISSRHFAAQSILHRILIVTVEVLGQNLVEPARYREYFLPIVRAAVQSFLQEHSCLSFFFVRN